MYEWATQLMPYFRSLSLVEKSQSTIRLPTDISVFMTRLPPGYVSVANSSLHGSTILLFPCQSRDPRGTYLTPHWRKLILTSPRSREGHGLIKYFSFELMQFDSGPFVRRLKTLDQIDFKTKQHQPWRRQFNQCQACLQRQCQSMFKNTRLNMNVSYNIEVATSMEIGSNFKIVEWADLVTLDLSTFDAPGGKEKLAAQLKDAVHNVGFFYITGFGLSQQEVDRQFAIGKEFFALPTEEKVKYKADLEHGNYNGYRPKGSGEILPGKRDNVEMYNVFKFSKFRPFSTSLQR
jgi:hypothetical protein